MRILFQDEARFGRISETRRCWCPPPHRPVMVTEVSQEYTYAYATVSVPEGVLDNLFLPHVNGTCMQIFLEEVAARYPEDRLLMVMDGAGWHRNQDLVIPDNMRLLLLPPYSPELNPLEYLWDALRGKWLS